jgi:crotonobetainyl-CoA:carnitine CoA-transferase CaiB-like acyl-CoA transferase
MSGPLSGFKIIDLTSMVSGPLTTMILADQGAEVLKIENPKGGDYTRGVSSKRAGLSASFLNNNRNKKSIALNLKEASGLKILLSLVKGADVFVQNFRPEVADRIGVGEAAIRAVVPDIIYVSISGFGDKGPYASKPVYDPLVQALSGLTSIQGGADDVRPRLVRTVLPDKLTGFTAAQAITAALLSRERTGVGQHVKLSMLDAMVSFLWSSDMSSQTFVGHEIPQEKAQSFIDLIYETKDGYISVAVQSDKQWQGLTRALERPEWLQDERFKTSALRHHNIDERLRLTQEVLLDKPAVEWLERLEAQDVPCAPVLRRSEMIDHPQIIANDILKQNHHPQAGLLRQARGAALFSQTPPTQRYGAPLLGQHSLEELKKIGLSDDDFNQLINDGVVAAPTSEPQT